MFVVICLLILLWGPVPTSAASFDCAKAANPVEKLICGDPELSRLDEELSAAYKKAASHGRDHAALVGDQQGWLKNERGGCRDADCLRKVYQERIVELNRWREPAPEDKDIFGNYVIQRDNFIYNPEKRREEPVKTEDCLTLTPSRGNALHFSLNLVGANGHMCMMDGEAILTGSVYQAVRDPGDPDIPKDCRLLIHIKRHAIELEDPQGACREYFCGARAVLDGAVFGRRQKTSKPCSASMED